MKKLLLIIFVIYSIVNVNAQSCLPGGITFERQAQIDSFPYNYPGCKSILGPVIISEATPGNITNLDSLIQIEMLESVFIITNNTALASLKGLDSLKMVRHDFEIRFNPLLNSITALNALYRTGRALKILNCPSLKTLEGLGNLRNVNGFVLGAIGIKNFSGLDLIQKIEGTFSVTFCPDLETFEGFGRNIIKTSSVTISNCPKISNLNGLDVFTSISENLSISNCLTLTSMQGLTASNYKRLIISGNPLLSSLAALPQGVNNLEEVSIFSNPMLSVCHVKSICDYLAKPANISTIYDNLTDCDSREAILAVCAKSLPVLLTDLRAATQGQSVILSWKTLTEVNSKGFEIQRSAKAAQWQSIGMVQAFGNSSSVRNYSYLDAKPSNGLIYYRLKLMDLDGLFSYSNVVNTRISPSGIFTLSPNPATQFVEINGLEKAQVKVMDANGRVLITQPVNGNTNINISGLSKGLYFFEVTSENDRKVQKIMKQ